MFLGWTPILASYGYVLDPISTFETGAITTFTSEVTLFQQRGIGNPALGILTLAALVQAITIWRLGWRPLWPIPVFLAVSCLIYVFNGVDTGTFTEYAAHAVYAVFATWAAYLFLRHGHLMSVGFGGYVALLFLDVLLDWMGLEGGLLGFLFFDYAPSLVTTAIFLAITVLTRMVWLIVRDNRDFVRSLDRIVFRQTLRRTLRLWWPMPVIFLIFGIGWWAVGHYLAVPTAFEFAETRTAITEGELEAWIAEQRKALRDPPKPRGFSGFVEAYVQYAREVARLSQKIRAAERTCGHFSEAFRQYEEDLVAQRKKFQTPSSGNAPKIAHRALLAETEASFKRWRAARIGTPTDAPPPIQIVCEKAAPEGPRNAAPRTSEKTPEETSEEATEGTSEATPEATPEDSLEHELQQLVELQTLLASAQAQLTIIEAGKGTKDLKALPETVRGELEKDIIPEKELPRMKGPKNCFPEIFRPACVVKKTIADGVNRAMRKLRREMINAVVETIEGPATKGAKTADEAMFKALAETQTQFDGFESGSIGAIKRGFQTWRNVSLLATLYSLIVLFKTFLIVFSRVLFSPKVAPDLAAPFLPEEQPDGTPQLTRHAQVLRIPVDDPDAHFVSRWGVTLEGPPPARRRPLGLRFPIVRVLTGTWSMNRIDGGRDPEDYEFDADLKVDEPAELVSWRLREGEQVVFRFQDFVGMGETVNVRRVASLSITTLILGRMIYYVAEGPGVLILRTTAAARISSDSEAHRPAPMPKLVAWAANTCFGILAAQTTVDTFMSGYNLKTGEADTVIWDTSTRRGNGPGTGILRFVKSFLLPI